MIHFLGENHSHLQGVAQAAERSLWERDAVGSSPTTLTIAGLKIYIKIRKQNTIQKTARIFECPNLVGEVTLGHRSVGGWVH